MKTRNSQAAKKLKAGSAAPLRVGESPDCRTVSLEKAAEILGISRSVAYAYANAEPPKLPVIRIGTRWLVPKAALERLFAESVPAQA